MSLIRPPEIEFNHYSAISRSFLLTKQRNKKLCDLRIKMEVEPKTKRIHFMNVKKAGNASISWIMLRSHTELSIQTFYYAS